MTITTANDIIAHMLVTQKPVHLYLQGKFVSAGKNTGGFERWYVNLNANDGLWAACEYAFLNMLGANVNPISPCNEIWAYMSEWRLRKYLQHFEYAESPGWREPAAREEQPANTAADLPPFTCDALRGIGEDTGIPFERLSALLKAEMAFLQGAKEGAGE